MDKLLTPEEVAERLNVVPSTIKRWLRQGRIPGVKPGKSWLIPEGDLEDFLTGGGQEVNHASPYSRILEHIAERGFTVEEVANKTGLPVMRFMDKVNGRQPFFIDEVMTIRELLNLRGEELRLEDLFDRAKMSEKKKGSQ